MQTRGIAALQARLREKSSRNVVSGALTVATGAPLTAFGGDFQSDIVYRPAIRRGREVS